MIRGWKAREANILGSREYTRNRTSIDRVLGECWLETLDPGPYKLKDGKIAWDSVLLCDRFWAMLCMRTATYGDSYEFTVPCQDRNLCGKRIEWECSLMKLPFRELPPESREKIANGDNRFEVILEHGEAAGRRAVFHLQTGAHEKKAAAWNERQSARAIVSALAFRIDEIEGVGQGQLVRFLDDLEMGEILGLVDTFDAADGGVDTTIEIECPHCGLLQDVDLPFGRDFYMPPLKRRRSPAPIVLTP
jgi:hypothetical protein